MYQEALGKPVNDAGDLYGYKGVNIVDGRDSSQKPIVPVAPLAQQPDITGQMAQLKKAQLAAAMAGLDKQKNASLSNLSAEKATIAPAYQKSKIAADVTAQQGARSFDEYMAQRGGGISGNNKSGIAGQGTLLNTIAYQGQKGALDQAEASAISDNARRVTGVNNAYESDVQGANAGVEAQHLQSYINQLNQDRTFNYGVSRDNVIDNRYADETAYGRGRDTVIDNRYANETAYGRGRDTIVDNRYTDETAYSRNQDALNRVIAAQQLAASQAKASAARAKVPAGTKGVDGGKYSDTSTASLKTKMDAALADGASVGELLYELNSMDEDGSAYLKNVDMGYLKSYLESKRQTMTDLRRSQGGGI
jgi:hypothetical protein